MKMSGAILGLTMINLTMSGITVAQTAPTTAAVTANTSTAAVETVAPSTVSKIGLTYSGLYHGFAINNPNSYRPSTTGGTSDEDNAGPQIIENSLGLAYRFTPAVSANGVFNWDWRPVRGQDLKLQNPYLSVKHAKLLSAGTFNMAADLRAILPVTQVSRDMDFRVGFRSNQILTYEIPGTKFTLASHFSERIYLYGQAAEILPMEKRPYDSRLYIGPSVSYQALPTLGVSLLFEADFVHKVNAPGSLLSFDTSPEDALDIEPALSWDITSAVNFSPYLNFYPRNLTLNSTEVGALLTVRFL